jgi:hypothetical protein
MRDSCATLCEEKRMFESMLRYNKTSSERNSRCSDAFEYQQCLGCKSDSVDFFCLFWWQDYHSSVHQGLDSWDQNDSFLNLNDCTSKRPFFNIGSKIPHKFANFVLICESQSNQRRPNLTWDLGFAFIDQMVPVNNLLQVIDLVIHIHEFGVRSLNLIAITILLIHIRSFIPNSFYFMLFSTCRLLCQSSLSHWANKSGPLVQSCVTVTEHQKVAPPSRIA